MSNNYQPLPAPNYNNPYNQNNNQNNQYVPPYQGQAYPNQPQQYNSFQQNSYDAPNNYNNHINFQQNSYDAPNNYNNHINAPPLQNPALSINQQIDAALI